MMPRQIQPAYQKRKKFNSAVKVHKKTWQADKNSRGMKKLRIFCRKPASGLIFIGNRV
jgi:hypothetical protein